MIFLAAHVYFLQHTAQPISKTRYITGNQAAWGRGGRKALSFLSSSWDLYGSDMTRLPCHHPNFPAFPLPHSIPIPIPLASYACRPRKVTNTWVEHRLVYWYQTCKDLMKDLIKKEYSTYFGSDGRSEKSIYGAEKFMLERKIFPVSIRSFCRPWLWILWVVSQWYSREIFWEYELTDHTPSVAA